MKLKTYKFMNDVIKTAKLSHFSELKLKHHAKVGNKIDHSNILMVREHIDM